MSAPDREQIVNVLYVYALELRERDGTWVGHVTQRASEDAHALADKIIALGSNP